MKLVGLILKKALKKTLADFKYKTHKLQLLDQVSATYRYNGGYHGENGKASSRIKQSQVDAIIGTKGDKWQRSGYMNLPGILT